MDVLVWVDKDQVVSYQINYDKPHAEKALVWSVDKGFSIQGVDVGSHSGKHPQSPLLIANGSLYLPRLFYHLNKNFGEEAPEI